MLQAFHTGSYSSRAGSRSFSKRNKFAAGAALLILGPLGIVLVGMACAAMGLAILADKAVAVVRRPASAA